MRSDDGGRSLRMKGRIAGFSNRINSVLVPDTFMRYANRMLGNGAPASPSRLIIDVSKPGDVAIERFMADNSLEVAGDKSKAGAAYLLRVVIGIVMAVGALITLLSLSVLMLSISLLMEKNRTTIHRLLTLGVPLKEAGRPYRRMILAGCAAALALAAAALAALRALYAPALSEFGGESGGLAAAIATGTVLSAIIATVNILAVRRKVKSAWSLKMSNE